MSTQTEREKDTQTLAGDLMKFIYDEITQLPDVWQKIPAQQQNEILDRVEKQARHNIERAMVFSEQVDSDPGDKMGEVEDDELREFEGNEITEQKLDDLMEEEPEAFSAQ